MKTILLVDDSPILRRVMERILSPRYQIVGHAGSGLEGFEKFKALKPDLVLLDIIMPNCDGKECLQMILKISPDAKVIMASSLGDDSTVNECLKLGARAFITKDKISLTDGSDSELSRLVAEILVDTALKEAA